MISTHQLSWIPTTPLKRKSLINTLYCEISYFESLYNSCAEHTKIACNEYHSRALSFFVEISRGSHKWFSRLATSKIASHQLVPKLQSMAAELNLALGQDQIRCRKTKRSGASKFWKWKWNFGGPMAKWNELAWTYSITARISRIMDSTQKVM